MQVHVIHELVDVHTHPCAVPRGTNLSFARRDVLLEPSDLVASSRTLVDLASGSTWNGMTMTIDAQLELFARAVRACPHNLMSRRDLALIESRHIPECRHVAMELPDCGVIADVGSGGGFPGLVIAICRPDLDVHLIEATKKKAEFLFDTAEALDLDVTVHHARAEELGTGPLASTFPIVTARAVARLDVLLRWTLPLLLPGGELWAIKGEQWPIEVREARQVLRQMHASVARTPEDDEVTSPNQPRVVRIVRD